MGLSFLRDNGQWIADKSNSFASWKTQLVKDSSGIIDYPQCVLTVMRSEMGEIQVVNVGGDVVAALSNLPVDDLPAMEAQIREKTGLESFRLLVQEDAAQGGAD